MDQNNNGLTEQEKDCLNHLTKFWNSFLELPGNAPPKPDWLNPPRRFRESDDVRTVRDLVHALQEKIAFRVARRIDSTFWR
jgi:hypothetical protein